MESKTNESEINQDDLWKILNLYKNSEYLKKNILANGNQIISEEYYLINIKWIKKFKDIFHFNSIVNCLKNKYENLNMLQKNQIIIKNLPTISKKNRDELKIIQNEEIIVNNPEEESISYFYLPFFLVYPKYYEIILEGYIIDERIKCDIYIANKTFVIDLSNNIFEVGIFDTTFSYKLICLLKFAEKVNYKEEMYQIFSLNLFGYFYNNSITEDMLIEHSEISRDKFHLIRIFVDEITINKRKEKLKPIKNDLKEENLDISNNLGLYNFESSEISKLNSIIQMLSSIKEIYNLFMNSDKKNEIIKFNHIYIFSSFFLEAINYINGKSKVFDIVKKMSILLNFLDEDISKKDITEYLNFILQILHNELLFIPDNLKQQNLISYESPLDDRTISLNNFYNYYKNSYKKSIISVLFNWIKEKKVDCYLDNRPLYSSFKSFPLIEFNFDLLYRNQNQSKNLILDLINCFIDYQKISIDDNLNLPQCSYCNNIHPSKYIIHNTPPYFIIVLNRKNRNDIKIKYKNILDITSYIDKDSKFKIYQLIGVIMEEGNKYYAIIRDTNKGKILDKNEVWIKFQEKNISTININNSMLDIKTYNEVYNPINSRILLYKGIK